MTAGLAELAPIVLAVRDNPLRRQLLVSSLLGKHVPVAPSVVRDAADRLAALVAGTLRSAGADPAESVVIGFAETATGLSAAVAESLGARRDAHSTRYLLPGDVVDGDFEEAHSHAPGHLVLTGALPPGPVTALVLVDDEVTSGRTVLALARLLLARHPAQVVVVAALHDSRSAEQRADWAEAAAGLDAAVHLVAVHEVDAVAVAEAVAALESSGAALARVLPRPRAGSAGCARRCCRPAPRPAPAARTGRARARRSPLSAAGCSRRRGSPPWAPATRSWSSGRRSSSASPSCSRSSWRSTRRRECSPARRPGRPPWSWTDRTTGCARASPCAWTSRARRERSASPTTSPRATPASGWRSSATTRRSPRTATARRICPRASASGSASSTCSRRR
ncbi:hypothetical protein GSU72_00390 [Rathayibacter sp. VKM Ac-2760]|nr:hypothetical protein GSU72_00390 [Rathayibacter sp. VKM Ac-2760]